MIKFSQNSQKYLVKILPQFIKGFEGERNMEGRDIREDF
jgi:hypothetical protein